ncbi:zinc finger protein [Elysia marginata]|uniref:Zinc finger protein n=1 Tax=Elysia marginata TaxID=1093978 RepID=A0AAV4I964_9GAST|nr:zinc finger protein [Elysia marginata]
MTISDKEEVWRFWKTISAAVKIAVNGRGSIVQAPKRQRKFPIMQNMNSSVGKNYLQELDQNAISVYVPLKSSNKANSIVKYRVLKFADQRKIADYVEEVQQQVNSVEKSINKRSRNDEDVCSDDHNDDDDDDVNFENRDVSFKGIQPSILRLITASSKDSVPDDGLKTVAKYLQDASLKQVTKPSVERRICNAETKSPSAEKGCKPSISTKKVWPVGRPTTRALSSIGTKNYSSPKAVENKLTLNTSPLFDTPTGTIFHKNVKKDMCQSGLNTLEAKQNFENNINFAKTFSTSDSDLQAEHRELYTNQSGSDLDLQVKKKQAQEEVSFDTAGGIVSETTPAFDIHAENGPECRRKGATDSDPRGTEPHGASSTSFSEHQQSQSSQSRIASDIETIISALEEELKKSGPNLTNISLTSQGSSWPPSTSAEKLSSFSPTTNSSENVEINRTILPVKGSYRVDDNVSATIAGTCNTQTTCLNLQSSVGQAQASLTNAFGNTDDRPCRIEQPVQCNTTTSHDVAADADESIRTENLQASSPIKVAAYIGELGQTISADVGQVTTLLDESGQQVQVLHGQEVLEVDGSIDNIIWACDGEVQIMQQLQHKEENVEIEEAAQQEPQGEASMSLSESQPVQAHYDVVEYEVLSDKRLKRGRKKKTKCEGEPADDNENESGNSGDILDRTCPICHRVLNYASSMKAHMRIHTGARPYSCGQCDRKFTTKANRDRHEATHVGLKPFKCQECGKSFTEKRSLKIHMRSHTGERPYVCETCGQGFAQKCTLEVHKVRHTDKRAHLCDLCGKAFRQKNQLEVHVKRHKRQAAYPCEHCETRCYTKGDLMRHMVKHTGERPYVCQLCPRAFTRKQYLIDHENQHYNRKPYSCSECGMSFHDMGSCHRHLRKHKNSKEESKETLSKLPHKLPVLNVDVVHKMMSTAKPGQVLKLEDGSDAIVKEVTSDADGSTVYHITCLNLVNDAMNTSTMSVAHYQQTQPQQQQQHADSLALSHEAIIKVEDPGNPHGDHTMLENTQEFKDDELSNLSKVADFAVGNVGDHETVFDKR